MPVYRIAVGAAALFLTEDMNWTWSIFEFFAAHFLQLFLMWRVSLTPSSCIATIQRDCIFVLPPSLINQNTFLTSIFVTTKSRMGIKCADTSPNAERYAPNTLPQIVPKMSFVSSNNMPFTSSFYARGRKELKRRENAF